MKSEQVAAYLQEHPEFFEEYADVLANIYLPHPHGGRAIPISERQILSLREKNRALESKLKELIDFGEENDAIGERLHRLTIALIGARDFDTVLHDLYFNLREDFAVPHVALRLWPAQHGSEREEFREAGEEARLFTESLSGPYCIGHPMFDTAAWFGEDGGRLRSFAYVPVKGSEVTGLLALASEEPQRFYPEMGTLYLKRLAEMVVAAVQRVRAGT
jgi:uncharacterized protein YigA (DUF484 family)